jgi:hypothetical protein
MDRVGRMIRSESRLCETYEPRRVISARIEATIE